MTTTLASYEETLNELIQFAKKANLEELVWSYEGTKIAFRREKDASVQVADPVSDQEPEATAPEPEQAIVRSPMVGTFRRGLTKGRPPVVMIGNHINPGDRLGVVECMKIPTDVVSYVSGEIKQIMVEEGQTVEYGQPLLIVTPSEGASEKN